MKHLKKLTAIILAACMLIGMPLSLDVAATDPARSFHESWSQRKEGDTFKLYRDEDLTADSALVVPAGVTLDLNGHTLAVPYFVSFGNVIDTGAEKGLLQVGKDTSSFAKLQAENTYLPLYNSEKGGYQFFTYDIISMDDVKVTKNSDDVVTSLKYGIQPYFDDYTAYTLLQNAANADTTLTFTIALRYPNAPVTTMNYTFSSSILSEFARQYTPGSKKVITLTISGIKSIADKAEGQPTSISIDTHSTIQSGTGVMHDSTANRYDLGDTPAQAAFKWIDERINNHDLISFTHKNSSGQDMSDLSNRSFWTFSTAKETGTYDADHDWTKRLVYAYNYQTSILSGNLMLILNISFNAKHAAIEWSGEWQYTHDKKNPSYAIADVQILNAPFTINGAVMTTARQGGQSNSYDYQPYSVDLTKESSYSMKNTNGRSSQGAWPYFDLTSKYNTYGIMGAIGWTGDWECEFTYENGAVTVEAGMQNTNYQMAYGECLRTPSMVIQFFKGTQDDGHNAWRQLILDEYTPDNVHTYTNENGKEIPCAPISILTWGGIGEEKMLEVLNNIGSQYFEYQWIDAGWYGNTSSANDTYKATINGKEDFPWHSHRGDWYYNPTAYPNGFEKINEWHETYKKANNRDTGLIVWLEPSYVAPNSNLAMAGNGSGTVNKYTGARWKNSYLFSGQSEVDYGIPEALDYVKKIVLYNLNNLQADIYRQDFNTDNLSTCWAAKDQSEVNSILKPYSNRTGVAEIKYVMGHYELLDAVLAAGYKIDNCASGGRMLDIEMMKRSIPLWRTDSNKDMVASGIRSQGASLSWWLPISGGADSSENLSTEYAFRSTMGSGVVMGVYQNKDLANKLISELLDNREMMLGDYYILQQGLHEGLTLGSHHWTVSNSNKDYTNTTNAAYEYYLEEEGKGYLVAFRPNDSTVATETFKLKGLDAHADYEVRDADTGKTFVRTGRYLMEQGLKLNFADVCTSHMIYFTKQ